WLRWMCRRSCRFRPRAARASSRLCGSGWGWRLALRSPSSSSTWTRRCVSGDSLNGWGCWCWPKCRIRRDRDSLGRSGQTNIATESLAEGTMQLQEYLRILWRRGWIMIALAVLTAAAAFGFSLIVKQRAPLYKSTIDILVQPARSDFGQAQAAKQLLGTYQRWLNSSYRAADVIENLQL